MVIQCPVTIRICFTTQSYLECKSKTEELENICQNLQSQKQQEKSNIQCKMKHIFFEFSLQKETKTIVKNQFHLVGSEVRLFPLSSSLLVRSPLRCFNARILCLSLPACRFPPSNNVKNQREILFSSAEVQGLCHSDIKKQLTFVCLLISYL